MKSTESQVLFSEVEGKLCNPAGKNNLARDFDLPLARFVQKYKNTSVLHSKNGRTTVFFTEDSKLYITPAEYLRMKRGERIVRLVGRLDSLHARAFEKTRRYETFEKNSLFGIFLRKRYDCFRRRALELAENSTQKISLAKMWNLSLVGAVIFGMLTMTMIYRYLGQGVSAKVADQQASEKKIERSAEKESGIDFAKGDSFVDPESIAKFLLEYEAYNDEKLEAEIRAMVKGYPIEKMASQIARRDRIVAAFLISIAKKESNWGKRIPVYQGRDCFNYWGWRGKNPVGSGGHTCFASPEDAVDTVAKRIEVLVNEYKKNTPEKMIIWKCGSDCEAAGGWAAANKWISDVDIYFERLKDQE